MKSFATLTAITTVFIVSAMTAFSARAGEVKSYHNPGLDRLNQLQEITGIQVFGDNNNLQLLQQQAPGGSNHGEQTIQDGSGGYTPVQRIPYATNSFNPSSSSTSSVPITDSLNPTATSSLELNHSLNPSASLNLTNSLNPYARAYSGSYSGSYSGVVVTPTTSSSSVSNPSVYVAPTSSIVNGSGNSYSNSAIYNFRR